MTNERTRDDGSEATSQFTDPNTRAEALIEFLDRQVAAPETAERYRLKYDLLDLKEGESVLDLGCGAGADLFRIARAVGPSGRAVGLDVNPAMVEAVRERAAAAGVEAELTDGGPLPFADATFDAVHTERVLIHVADPDLTVAELVRVLKPGGRLVSVEPDQGTRHLMDLDDMELFERVYGPRGAGSRNQYMGRQLFRRFVRAGLREVTVATVPIQFVGRPSPDSAAALGPQTDTDLRSLVASGRITEAEADRFRAQIQARFDAHEYFRLIVSMVARGVKPG